VPWQRQQQELVVWDWGQLGLGGEIGFWSLLRWGWGRPRRGRWRIWHARRDIEILIGLLLRSLLRQPWRVVFTSAAPKRPGWWLRQLIRRCDAVIATSPRSAAFLERCDAVIFHGVDCEQFYPAADREAVLADVGLAGQQVIASFGRIRPSKGTDLFVDALLTVLPRFPDWTAVITGLCQQRDLPYLKVIQQQIAASGLQQRIHFVGDLGSADIRRWYQRASICVAASRCEGFGLTPLEAMASGCVPITSQAGAWPWIIRPEFGVMTESGEREGMITALQSLMADPIRLAAMAAEATSVARNKYSVDREAALINALYAKIAGNGASP
jgi:mannosyltransferase